MRLPWIKLVVSCGCLLAVPAAGQVIPQQPKPWEDPTWDRPENAARREALEFTPMFNRARERPPRSLRLLKQKPNAYRDPDHFPPTVLLGDMLWHAPRLLGPRAAAFGVSCNSCHPNGAVSNTIDAGESSDRSGNIDLLSDYFSPLADDGVWAPRNVASMRGARYNFPYLRSGALHSLSEGVVATITGEFGQSSRPEYVGALTVFLFEQDFVPNSQLDELGRLTARAPAAAREGEKVFKASREAYAGKSCGSCHVPESFFTDHRPHPFAHGTGKGTTTAGEAYKTSTLVNLVESWPYFFDGSAANLAEAVELIDARHKLGLSAAEKSDLAAYLAAVGAVDEPARIPTLTDRFEESLPFLSLALVGPYQDDAGVWELTLDTVRHGLRGAVREAPEKDRARVEALVQEYERLVSSAEAKKPNPQTRKALGELRARLLVAVSGQKSGKATASKAGGSR